MAAAAAGPGVILFSTEPGRAGVTLMVHRFERQIPFRMRIFDDPARDDDPSRELQVTAQDGAVLAAALRIMAPYARGGGESPYKVEHELRSGGWSGIHATDGAVSLHLGRDRAELVVQYIHLAPADADRLAAVLGGTRDPGPRE